MRKIWYSSVASVTLHLTCAFQVIKLPDERVMVPFYHFFLRVLHIVEIGQKAHNTTTSRPPVPCIIYQYWQLLICVLVDLGWVSQQEAKGQTSNG